MILGVALHSLGSCQLILHCFYPGSRSFVHILYYHYTLLRHPILPHASPDFLTRHCIVCLFQVHKYHICSTLCFSRCFSISGLNGNIASVVPLPGMKPNCPSPIVVSFLRTRYQVPKYKVYLWNNTADHCMTGGLSVQSSLILIKASKTKSV